MTDVDGSMQKPGRDLRNFNWLLIGRAVSLAAGLLSLIVITRALGPESFGKLSYALAFAGLFTPLAEFGLNAIVVRSLVQKPSEKGRILGAALLIRFAAAGSALLAALLIMFVLPVSDASIRTAVVLLLIAEFFRAGLVFSFAFEASGRFLLIAATNTGIALLFAAGKVWAALEGARLEELAALFALEIATVGCAYIALYGVKEEPLNGLRLSLPHVKSLTLPSSLLALSSVFAIMNLKLDQVMIGEILDDSAVGLYAAAVRISEFWYFVPPLIAGIAFRHMVRLHHESKDAYSAICQSLLDGLVILSVFMILLTVLFGGWFIGLVYGADYSGSAAILLVHIYGGMFVAMRAVASKWIVAEDILLMSIVSHALGALVNFGLNLFLIESHGIQGAALATVWSYFISGYAVFFLHRGTRPIAIMMTKSLLMPLRIGQAIKSLRGQGWRESVSPNRNLGDGNKH